MIGQPIPPAREAWEHDQIKDMRRRMELMQRVRVAIRAALMTIGIICAVALAHRLLS
jgi:hypothetical protein